MLTSRYWSQAEVQKWANEEEFDPIGMGSTSCDCNPEDRVGKFVWLGTFTKGDIYYVVVKHKGDVPSSYMLTIEGKEVSQPFEPLTAEPAAEAETAAMAEPVSEPAAQPEVAVGTTPDTAMASNGDWVELPTDAVHWYKFNYVADRGLKHDQDPPIIEAVMYVRKPVDSTYFDVWTPTELAQLIAKGEDILGKDKEKGTRVGCGTDNGDLKGDYSWSGSFMDSGAYYVRVQHTPSRNQPSSYQLQISGESVSD